MAICLSLYVFIYLKHFYAAFSAPFRVPKAKSPLPALLNIAWPYLCIAVEIPQVQPAHSIYASKEGGVGG